VRWHAEQGHDLAAHRIQAIDSKLVAAALAACHPPGGI
jgi:hypothetical protein